MSLDHLLHAALDVLFPPLCHVCRTFIAEPGRLHICPSCRERMPGVISPLCTVCGTPFRGAGDDHVCGDCNVDRPSWTAARSALLYEGACSDLIHAFKYRHRVHLRRPLALLAIEYLDDFVRAAGPEVIIPVPLHPRRLRSRGFNQAVLIGELFSRHWGIPLDRRALRRIRWTEPQVELPAAARSGNVKGAFAVTSPARVEGRRVLLVDDVLTTGSTLDECALVLRRGGAAGVYAATVARAVMP